MTMGTDPGGASDRSVRRRLAQAGPTRTRDAKDDFQVVTLPERDCDVLRDALTAEKARTVVEIGLAYGSSALAIGEALMLAGGDTPSHLIIDAFQESEYFMLDGRPSAPPVSTALPGFFQNARNSLFLDS
jgi:hypothetical protein